MKYKCMVVISSIVLLMSSSTSASTSITCSLGEGGYVFLSRGGGISVSISWSSDNPSDVSWLISDAAHGHFGTIGSFYHELNGWCTTPTSNTFDTATVGGILTGSGQKTSMVTASYNCSNSQYYYAVGYSPAYQFIKVQADDSPDECTMGDPISPLNGGLTKRDKDIPKSGRGGMLEFERRYDNKLINTWHRNTNLVNTWRWPLGSQWTHNYNIYLYKLDANLDSMILFDGMEIYKIFIKASGDSIYRSKYSDNRYLKYVSGPDAWVLYQPDGGRYKFKNTGQIDSLYDRTGNSLIFHYSSSDSLLDSVKDNNGQKIVFQYYDDKKLKYIMGPPDTINGLFYEYRYATYDNPGNTNKYLCQVLKHSTVETAESLVVISRYYYDVLPSYNIQSWLMNTYATPTIESATDTNWAVNRNKSSRLNCWYDVRSDHCFDGYPVVYQEMVTDSVQGNKVIYRALFKYYWGASGYLYGPDSVSAYYYEDSSSANSRNPLDTLFCPADSLPSAFGSLYYIATKRFNTTRTLSWERVYHPAKGDSSKTTYSQYDKNYHPWLVTDPNGSQTHFVYGTYTDPWNPDSIRYMDSPKIVKYPNGDSTVNFYSSKGSVNSFLPDSTVDEDGKRIHHHYDAAKNYADTAVVYKDRVLADGDDSAHDVTTRCHYSSKYNNLTEIIDPQGSKTIMHYAPGDTGRYLTEQRIDMAPSGEGNEDIVTQYGYNVDRGTMDTMTFYRDYPNNPSCIYYTYDQQNRQIRALNPDNSRDSTAYDLRGNVVGRYTMRGDTLFAKTTYEYDPHDHLTKVREYRAPNDSVNAYDSTLYEYNLHGRLIKQTNLLGKVTSYTYAMDRLRKISYPDTTSDSLGYWPDGSLKFKVDRKGQVIYYEYDGYSGGCLCNSRYRLTKKKYYDSLDHYLNGFNYPSDSVTYEYDKVGNRTKMVDKLGATLYAYDDLHRLKSDSCGYLNTKVKYLYDQANNRTRMKVFKGDDTTTCYLDQEYRHYDNANRVDTVRVDGKNIIFTYWDTGLPKRIVYPANYDGDYPFEEYWANSRGYIDSINGSYYSHDMAPHVQTYYRNRYTYNGLGDRVSHYKYLTRPGTTSLSGTIGYSYDGLRRLVQVRNPSGFDNGDTITYTYDAAGNRHKKDYRKTSDINYYYNQANNQLCSDGTSDFSYDGNGNLTYRELGRDRYLYSYDYENRLAKVKLSSDSTLFYYNGDGVRLKKQGTKDSSLQYIPDGMYSVVERRTNGNLKYKYIYANGLLLARIDSSGNKNYYYHDGLGSIIGISDGSNVCKGYLYDDFGDSLGSWGTVSNSYRYTGQEYDWTPLNAYNLRAREYYPKLGRFMQNDPIAGYTFIPNTYNRYIYTLNNPINYNDITGKSPFDICSCLYYAAKCALEGAKCKQELQKKIDAMTTEELEVFLRQNGANSISELFRIICFKSIPSCGKAYHYCAKAGIEM